MIELSQSLAEELYMDEGEIDVDRSFTELGLDSIVGVEWIHAINKKYQTSIKTTKIYQYPTLTTFADYFYDVLSSMEVNNINKEDSNSTSTNNDHKKSLPIIESQLEFSKKKETTIHPEIKKEALLKELSKSLAEELYMDEGEIDVDRSFTELGLDSIVGVEWIHAINKKYQTSIKTTKIYQYPNLVEFTKYMHGELVSLNENAESIIPSDDEMEKLLWLVYQGEMDIHNAEELIAISKKEG
nr:acyl carrier protein [Ornithinibacillus scapharcae]